LDAISEDVFYKTADDFKGALFASYSSMQSLNGTSTENLGERAEWWKITLMATDDLTFDPAQAGNGATSVNLDNGNFIPQDVAFRSVFTHIYQGIFRANLVLEKLDGDNNLTDAEKTAIGAEAKFLRGFYHFQSYKLWGGQGPLALETRRTVGEISLPNSTPAEFETAMLADFADAAAGLPGQWGDADLGRATSWSAKAYAGKVLIYAKRFSEAIPFLQDVYMNSGRALMPSHEDVFSFDFENNSESLFEMQYGSNSDDNGWVLDDNHSENFKASQGIMRAWWQDAGNGAPGGGLGIYVPTTELINEFEAGDPRAASTIYQSGDPYYAVGVDGVAYDAAWSPSGATMKKYRGVNVAKMNPVNFAIDYNNERIYRFADVILFYAEALIDGGSAGQLMQARDLINEVRARSFPTGTPVSSTDAAGLTAALHHERRVEFAFEGHRLFDIVRWGTAQSLFTAQGINFSTFGSSGAIFPLPQSEIDVSGGVLNQVN